MQRNQGNRSASGKAVVFTLAALLAGTGAGALLGGAGGLLPTSTRFAVGSLLAVVGVVVGLLGLWRPGLAVPQFDRETPPQWIDMGAWRWAALNGGALGVGATTRLGFWLWYVVPVGALLIGRADVGALIYGSYGVTRAGFAWLYLVRPDLTPGPESPGLLRLKTLASTLTSVYLILMSVAVVILVGLP